ncbi:Immunoglobulin omega chain [Sciurus carolinensis]|nr:Immunoglobulin omega chain [Sciurus carolinensis]
MVQTGTGVYLCMNSPFSPEGGKGKENWGPQHHCEVYGAASTMAWTHLLLLLLFHCSGSLSQPVLTQPPSASASLGRTAKLTCTLSSGYSGYSVDWYQQSPGKSPRFVMRVGTSGIVGSKGEGIPDRFSGSGSGLNRYLTIQNIQEQDEGIYHCGTDDGSE